MNEDRLRLIRHVFTFMILVDVFWDLLVTVLPLAILGFLSSTVTNTVEAVLFLVVLDEYYNGEIQVLAKWLIVAVVGVIAIIFLLIGGLVI